MSIRTGRYSTTAGSFRTDILPWRLFQKAKQRAWDPADIDFGREAADWASREEGMRRLVARLGTTFMVGEEAVTLDIVPLLRAIADEGRIEEAMFLTTFLGDEAKHAEFFRTWFDVVGAPDDLDTLLTDAQRRVFDDELPRAMGRLDDDRSPEAFLDASITYNHFVEGVLAMTGYWAWDRMFTMQDVFPGMRAGLELVQRDERRHLAYGTYLCRRIVAEHPETWPFVEQKMSHLRELGLRFVEDLGAAIFEDFKAGIVGQGEPTEEFNLLAKAIMAEFTQYGEELLERRTQAIAVARGSSIEEVERTAREEE
jgi:ribonucleoside-diphosphate reductase beta chain